ncbi:MAG TPA: isocitrate/isopropylmalate family dehydrogenase [Syntrophales bacterium]|nr:isocitrate/isopropylmalate family dehydrogenase [Syntrophales bacterium]
MKTYRIAMVPGDGVGLEVVPAGLTVLGKAAGRFGFAFETTHFEWGAGYYRKHGHFMPADGLDILRPFDAVYFGAVGLPDVDDTLPAKDYTFKVRTGFKQYVNYRPVRTWPGVTRPLRSDRPIDFVVIRENVEGEFVQAGKQIQPDEAGGLAIDTSIFTRRGIERIAHFAFQLAQKRRKRLHHITKSNTLIHSLTFWDRVIREVAARYPDVEHHQMYIDNAAASFVLRPEIFDVVLTTNLFGDILSDLGGALMGSLGLAGSGNINPERDYPSMFEPIHGSAPDIAGRGIANPYGTIWSGALMLEHLGETEAARKIVEAMDRAAAEGVLPVDLGGKATTGEIARRVALNLDIV